MYKPVVFIFAIILSVSSYSGTTEDSLLTVISELELGDSAQIEEIFDYTAKYTGTNIEIARVFADTMIYQCKKVNYVDGYLFGHIRKADIMRYGNKTGDCILFLNNFLENKLLADNKEFKARAYALLGGAHYDIGKKADCIDYYLKSVKIAEEIGIESLQSYLYNGLGLTYANQKDFDKAIYYHKKALAINKQLKREKTVGVSLANLGYTYNKMGNTDTSAYYFDKALGIYKKLNYTSGLATINMNMGCIYWGGDKHYLALHHMRKALYYDTKVGSIPYIFDDYKNIGKLFTDMQMYDSALIYFQKAQDLAENVDQHKYLKESHSLLSHLYSKQKKFDSAYYHLKKGYQHKDTLTAEANEKMALEIEEKYENEQKEAENTLLRIQKEKQAEIINLQRYLMVFLILLIISMLVLLYVIIKSQQKRKKFNLELQEKNLQLQEMNDMKVKFFSLISHDLRGPLGSLKNLAEIVFPQGIFTNDLNVKEKYIPLFTEEINNTYSLSNNVLTWARSQLDQIQFAPTYVNYRKECNLVVKDFSGRLESKQITIENTIDKGIFGWADADYLHTICRNLLSNAIKFSHKGSAITISAIVNSYNMVVVKISDQGVGMEQEVVDNLFVIGKTRSTQGTERERGTGLGLILCKEFVEKHNGTIQVESEPGKGTTVIVKLPVDYHIDAVMPSKQTQSMN